MCYRFLSHTTDDDDRTYRAREDVEAQRRNDPIPRFERVLREAGILDDTTLARLSAGVSQEVDAATDAVEAEPSPAVETLARNVHEGAHEPWR